MPCLLLRTVVVETLEVSLEVSKALSTGWVSKFPGILGVWFRPGLFVRPCLFQEWHYPFSCVPETGSWFWSTTRLQVKSVRVNWVNFSWISRSVSVLDSASIDIVAFGSSTVPSAWYKKAAVPIAFGIFGICALVGDTIFSCCNNSGILWLLYSPGTWKH